MMNLESSRPRIIVGLFVAIAPFASGFARADSCDPHASQLAMDLCAADDFHRADASLNALYDRIMKEPVFVSRLDKLRASERAWVSYRDAECRFEDSWAEGGSMQPMLNSDCARALTERRIADLTAALACVHDSGTLYCRDP